LERLEEKKIRVIDFAGCSSLRRLTIDLAPERVPERNIGTSRG
jgi:hypothetical protein